MVISAGCNFWLAGPLVRALPKMLQGNQQRLYMLLIEKHFVFSKLEMQRKSKFTLSKKLIGP